MAGASDRPNRQARRAAARRRAKAVVPMIRIHDVTPAEAELLAEACDAYRVQLVADLGEEQATWTAPQAWAYARAAQFRDMLQAAVEGRPVPHDTAGDRLEPVVRDGLVMHPHDAATLDACDP